MTRFLLRKPGVAYGVETLLTLTVAASFWFGGYRVSYLWFVVYVVFGGSVRDTSAVVDR